MSGGSVSATLLWRWSWRDLRRRWLPVVAIAAVIAIGTGIFAGLTSTSTWRRMSNDASFGALSMHDLRVELSPGSYVAQGRLDEVVRGIEDADAIESVSERLIEPTQVDASTAEETILVPGRLVGMESVDDAVVDGVEVTGGETIAAAAGDGPTAILDEHFVSYYDLPDSGSLQLAGGETLRYTGVGLSPEYFLISEQAGSFLGEANLAVLFAPLATVQELTGHAGEVDDAALTLAPGTDTEAIADQIEAGVAAELPGVSATVSDRDDVDAYRLLYEDIDADQALWNVISVLILFAAAFAAFNLLTRIVEAQRREIGVGMALGASSRTLAWRPLLLGAQVAGLGVLLGLGVGYLVTLGMRDLLTSFAPLPIWLTPFQYDTFALAAGLGFVVPIAATVIPVTRAVRVEPIDAIKPSYYATRGKGGLGRLARRIPLPGGSVARMPLRNVARAKRRTLLTAFGVGAAITALVAVMGMLDTFVRTIDIGEEEVLQDEPDRVVADLSGFEPVDGEVVGAVDVTAAVETVDPVLRLPATLAPGTDGELESLLTFVDFDSEQWAPTVDDAVEAGDRPGIVLTEQAADDLGVDPGGTVVARLPRRVDGGFETAEVELVVTGTNPNPIRAFAYAGRDTQAALGFDGLTNVLETYPAAGSGPADVQRAIFGLDGVASVQPADAVITTFNDAVEQFVAFLRLAQAAVLVLALLIAFNSSSITVDERTREHATMMSFGLPVRSVVGMVTAEGVIVGVAATVVGLVAGFLVISWTFNVLIPESFPDIGFDITLSVTSMAVALGVGILAVAIAPLFNVRRLARMDLPSALRVVE